MHWFRRRPHNLPAFVQSYLDAPRPHARLPWRDAGYTVLDLETTGFDPRADALVAVGLVEIQAGRVVLEQRWQTLVRPPAEAPVRGDAIATHGLLRGDTATAPVEGEILPELLARLRGRVLVVHVADMDVKFLDRALRRHYGVGLRGPALDTARLAANFHHQQRFVGGDDVQPSLQLRDLCAQLGLPVYAEHDALGDAITTAQLFVAQATRLEQAGAKTLGALLRAGGCVR